MGTIIANQINIVQREITIVLDQHCGVLAVRSYRNGSVFQGNSIVLFQMERLAFCSSRTYGRVPGSISMAAKINGQVNASMAFAVEQADATPLRIIEKGNGAGLAGGGYDCLHCFCQGHVVFAVGLCHSHIFYGVHRVGLIAVLSHADITRSAEICNRVLSLAGTRVKPFKSATHNSEFGIRIID